MAKKDYFSLRPHADALYQDKLTGYLLLPLFGLGLFWLKKRKAKLNSVEYRIFNDRVTIIKADSTESLSLDHVDQLELVQDKWDKKHQTGTLVLKSKDHQLELWGIHHPDELKSLLYSAIATEKENAKKRTAQNEGDYAHLSIGGLEHLNSLVGLWQAGLISDEDFNREQEKFRRS